MLAVGLRLAVAGGQGACEWPPEMAAAHTVPISRSYARHDLPGGNLDAMYTVAIETVVLPMLIGILVPGHTQTSRRKQRAIRTEQR